MTHEEFKAQRQSIPDLELAEKAELLLNKLCKTGGQSFTMTVPPRLDDTDMVLSEVIERFKKLSTQKTKEELLEQFALDFDYEKLKQGLLKLDLSEKDLKDLEYLEDNNFIGIFNDLRDSKIKKREV